MCSTMAKIVMESVDLSLRAHRPEFGTMTSIGLRSSMVGRGRRWTIVNRWALSLLSGGPKAGQSGSNSGCLYPLVHNRFSKYRALLLLMLVIALLNMIFYNSSIRVYPLAQNGFSNCRAYLSFLML